MQPSRLIVIVFLLGASALALYMLQGVFASIVFAGVCAMLLQPMYAWVLKKFKGHGNIASFVVSTLLVLLVAGIIIFLFISLWREFLTFYWRAYAFLHISGMQDFVSSPWWKQISALLKTYGINEQGFVKNTVLPFVNNLGAYGSKFFAGVVSNMVNFGFAFVLMIVSLFFFLRDGDRFGQFIIKFSPLTEHQTRHMIQTFKRVIEGILLGNFLTAIVQGIIGGIGLWLFGFPTPILWGTIMSIMAMIPFVGPGIIYLPATAFLFLSTGSIEKTLLYLAYNVLIVSTIDNIIKPGIIGTRTNIHPLIILLSLVGGIKLWGVVGIIYGPLVAALLLLAIDFYLEETKQRSLF